MNQTKLFLSGLAIAGILSGVARGDEESLAELVEGNRSFAIALHKELARDEGNLFYSPYSISTALAMTFAGAREETEVQMAEALRFPFGASVLSPIFGELQRVLKGAQSDGVEFHVANSLWPYDTYEFEPDYLELVRKHFQSEVNPVNFADPEPVRLRINGWIEEATREKIRDMIPAGALSPMTRMVLANAVYFKGMWASRFREEATTEQPFYTVPGKSAPVKMMHQQLETGYGETEHVQLLELPYKDERIAMMIVLPKGKRSLAQTESRMSTKAFAAWEQELRPQKVDVYLPRFSMTADFQLNQIMMKLGMTDAFDPAKADFSGMDGLINNLYISDILHKAFVDVSEEGTEAAAATAIIMRTTAFVEAPPVPVFRADRPFLFFIKDRTTGSILFTGRFAKP